MGQWRNGQRCVGCESGDPQIQIPALTMPTDVDLRQVNKYHRPIYENFGFNVMFINNDNKKKHITKFGLYNIVPEHNFLCKKLSYMIFILYHLPPTSGSSSGYSQ